MFIEHKCVIVMCKMSNLAKIDKNLLFTRKSGETARLILGQLYTIFLRHNVIILLQESCNVRWQSCASDILIFMAKWSDYTTKAPILQQNPVVKHITASHAANYAYICCFISFYLMSYIKMYSWVGNQWIYADQKQFLTQDVSDVCDRPLMVRSGTAT